MIFRGIVGKLWLSMLVLVVVVLGLSALIQTGSLEKIYYNQQSSRLVEEGERLASFIAEEENADLISRRVMDVADLLHASILVIDNQGLVEHWYGMGTGMGNGMGNRMGMGRWGLGQGRMPFDSNELDAVLQGENVIRLGHNTFFNMDTLFTAIPIRPQEGAAVVGAVVINAPLAPLTANLRALQVVNLYALLVGALAATLLSLLVSRTLSRPMRDMNDVARAMARGDYSRRVPVKGGDEMAMLADSLNTLSSELQEKIAALEKLDSTRREFVANVSHELRTPLTIIQGYTEAIIDGMVKGEGKKQHYLRSILDEILRLRRLVDDLLDLRRMEAGQVLYKKGPVDVSQLICRVVERFNGLAEEKEIHLSTSSSGPLPITSGDPDRLEQVLNNLVDNAIRLTPSGGRVSVNAILEAESIRVLVKDTGPGIPPNEQELVWERFYKVDKSRFRAGGSGLGLAIARRIVEMHGGKIGVESEPGEGATFFFTIPLVTS